MKKVLLINAHQRYEGFAEGNLTKKLLSDMEEKFVQNGMEVKYSIIASNYDAQEELEKHLWADMIVFQTPVYWMSVPWIAKQYMDTVYTINGNGVLFKDDGRSSTDSSKKYGIGGLIKDKKYMLSTTWNAPLEAFEDKSQFFDGNDVDALFIWLHKTYQFLGFEKVDTFSCFDVIKNPQISKDLVNLDKHLEKIIKG